MKILLLLFISISIISCEKGGDPELIGNWKTIACEQAKDRNDVPYDSWGRGIYEFTSLGTIIFYPETYDDSQCTNKTEIQNPISYEASVTYQDNGEVTLQEGISGHAFIMTISAQQETHEFSGFYSISNRKLCFSSIFRFDAFGFGAFSSGEDAIDFEICLTK